MHIQNKSLATKLALVLLSIVVLELILTTGQVQSVKAIKKKLLLKKLKKILPLLALVKPKKKIILVPIPFPMFNKQQPDFHAYDSGQLPQQFGDGGQISFQMMAAAEQPMQMVSMSPSGEPVSGSEPPPVAMLVPTMTVTVRPDSGESPPPTTTAAPSAPSANLLQRPSAIKSPGQQSHLSQNSDSNNFDDFGFDRPAGEQYYSSPWEAVKPADESPSRPPKLPRDGQQPNASPAPSRLAQSAPPQQQQYRSANRPPIMQAAFVTTPPRVHWDESGAGQLWPGRQQQQPLFANFDWRPQSEVSNGELHFQRQLSQHELANFEIEELVPVGPPQLMPVYQTPNGQLHMSPPAQTDAQQQPPPKLQADSRLQPPREVSSNNSPSSGSAGETRGNQLDESLNGEVQTIRTGSAPSAHVLEQPKRQMHSPPQLGSQTSGAQDGEPKRPSKGQQQAKGASAPPQQANLTKHSTGGAKTRPLVAGGY